MPREACDVDSSKFEHKSNNRIDENLNNNEARSQVPIDLSESENKNFPKIDKPLEDLEIQSIDNSNESKLDFQLFQKFDQLIRSFWQGIGSVWQGFKPFNKSNQMHNNHTQEFI